MPVFLYDVALDDDGDLPAVTRHITGAALIYQRIDTRIQTYLAEWYLDETKGLPIIDWTQQKPPDTEGMGSIIRADLLEIPGLERIDNWLGEVNRTEQKVRFACDVVIDTGEILEIEIWPMGRRDNSFPLTTMWLKQGTIAK